MHRNDSVDQIRKYLETTLSPKAYKLASHPSKLRAIVAVGDLHGNPHPALLPHIIALQPDLIAIGGDAFDLAKFSAHPKEWGERSEEFEAELRRLVAYIEILLTKTKAMIIIMRGNHDNRVYRMLSDLIPGHLLQFIKIKDPLQLLVDGLNSPRVSLNMQQVTAHAPRIPEVELGKSAYLLPLGDAVLSHNNFTGGEPGQAALKLQKWSDEWHQYLGWAEPRLLVQFHVHQWSFQFKRGGHLCLVEPGMGGSPAIESYKTGYASKWKPGTLGALSFTQQCINGEWVTLLETVKPILP